MKTTTIIEITGPNGEKTRLSMNLEHFDDMTKQEIQDGVSDYHDLLIADFEDSIADLEKQWEDG